MSNELLYAFIFSLLFFVAGFIFAGAQNNGGAIFIAGAIVFSAVIICIKIDSLNKNK